MSSGTGQTSTTQNTTGGTFGSGTTSTGMGSSATGVPNHIYDLVSVYYHCLKSGTTNAQYLQDAQQSGDNDLLQFFQQVQQEDRQRAQKAQQLLAQKLSSTQPTH